MKFEDVVALAKAGYTADQIAKMAPLADKQQPTAPDVQQPAPAVQQPAAQIEQPAPAVQPDPILAALEKLTNAVQANGIMRAEQPAEPSEEEILASIIMPTKKEE